MTLLYVLRSFQKMFFNILGNCYKMCPIKCFYILCSVSNVAMVSWLSLLYVLILQMFIVDRRRFQRSCVVYPKMVSEFDHDGHVIGTTMRHEEDS